MFGWHWHRWGAVIITRGAYGSVYRVRACQHPGCTKIKQRKIIRGVI